LSVLLACVVTVFELGEIILSWLKANDEFGEIILSKLTTVEQHAGRSLSHNKILSSGEQLEPDANLSLARERRCLSRTQIIFSAV
jgi:hypothetical protein